MINTNSPQQSRSLTGGGGHPQLQTINLSYSTMAVRPGTVTIPPLKARINGLILETKPITLNVQPAPEGTRPVRAWVSETKVAVGKPFWIYIEASGSEITLPNTLQIEGIEIDPRNSQRSSSYSFGRAGMSTNEKRKFGI